LLIHHSGVTLALDSLEPDTKLDNLSKALMMAQQYVAQQMKSDLGTDVPIRQSYFGTEQYNICIYQVNDLLFAGVVFGPAVKEGQVWYRMRDIADKLALALESEIEELESDETSVKDELMAMLDHYIPAKGTRRSSRRTPSSRTAPQADSPSASQSAQETIVRAEPANETAVEKEPKVSISEPDIAVDDINWNAGEDTEWDTVVSETSQSFSGISFAQAQQQGLLTSDVVPSSSEEEKNAGAPTPDQGPPVEEINWDVPADIDWDELVAETDQGFDGFSLDEAQQKGIIDDLNEE
jgi:hypothetical protein